MEAENIVATTIAAIDIYRKDYLDALKKKYILLMLAIKIFVKNIQTYLDC